MVQPPGSLRFVHEAHTVLGFCVRFLASQRDGLQGHDAVDLGVARPVDNAHGAAAEFAEDLVASELLGGGILHPVNLAALRSLSSPGQR